MIDSKTQDYELIVDNFSDLRAPISDALSQGTSQFLIDKSEEEILSRFLRSRQQGF